MHGQMFRSPNYEDKSNQIATALILRPSGQSYVIINLCHGYFSLSVMIDYSHAVNPRSDKIALLKIVLYSKLLTFLNYYDFPLAPPALPR